MARGIAKRHIACSEAFHYNVYRDIEAGVERDMNCKITRNAAKVLQRELDNQENKDLKVRIFITHSHGDHAHYGLDLTLATEMDEVVTTDKGIDVVLSKDVELLDGVKIDYLYLPEEGFVITNPSKGNHGDH